MNRSHKRAIRLNPICLLFYVSFSLVFLFLWPRANRLLPLLIEKSDCEQFAHVAHDKRATGAICYFSQANHSFTLSLTKKRAIRSKTDERIPNQNFRYCRDIRSLHENDFVMHLLESYSPMCAMVSTVGRTSRSQTTTTTFEGLCSLLNGQSSKSQTKLKSFQILIIHSQFILGDVRDIL